MKAEAGNGVIGVIQWIAYGGCFSINAFDGVTARAGATRLARFTNPSGDADYIYSAATLNTSGTNRIVSMPYDFMFIYTAPGGKVGAPLSVRANIVGDILVFLGNPGNSDFTGTDLPGTRFAVTNYPNPYNPATKISYTIAAAGHLSLKIFNVRGELVKTLIDGHVESSDFVMWDGANNQGGNVSSGVYFCEARMGNDVKINKMSLIK